MKKINFKMPPKPKVIRTKPELTGKGDATLRELHSQHFTAFENNIGEPKTYIAKHSKLINELYGKTHDEIKRTVVDFFKAMITNFTSGES